MAINSEKIRRKIVDAVAKEPRAADDDRLLMSLIWAKEGWSYGGSIYTNLCRVSSPETIRRTRQKLVQDGVIQPSSKALKARAIKQEQTRLTLIGA